MDSISEVGDDLFKNDIFAAENQTVETASANLAENHLPPPLAPVIWRLPKIELSARTDWNALLAKLPLEILGALPARLAGALADLLNLDETAAFAIRPLFKIEINGANDFSPPRKNQWWLVLRIEPSAEKIFINFDTWLAQWLIDRMLDAPADGRSNSILSEFTATETAILEFVALNAAHRTNQIFQTTVFKFDVLQAAVPTVLTAALDRNTNFLAADFALATGDQVQGVVRIYASAIALENLQSGENALLDSRRNRFADFARRVTDLPARINFGQAELTLGEINALEKGDVVLLENHSFTFTDRNFYGRAEIRLGDHDQIHIAAEFSDYAPPEFEAENDDDNYNAAFEDTGKTLIHPLRRARNWTFMITDLPEIEDSSAAEPADYETGDAPQPEEDAGGIDLADLHVTMRVELTARRLSLAEIAALRVNQVLELGNPNEAVELLIDNRTIGRGELVAVEDRLGVRIVKLYG